MVPGGVGGQGARKDLRTSDLDLEGVGFGGVWRGSRRVGGGFLLFFKIKICIKHGKWVWKFWTPFVCATYGVWMCLEFFHRFVFRCLFRGSCIGVATSVL